MRRGGALEGAQRGVPEAEHTGILFIFDRIRTCPQLYILGEVSETRSESGSSPIQYASSPRKPAHATIFLLYLLFVYICYNDLIVGIYLSSWELVRKEPPPNHSVPTAIGVVVALVLISVCCCGCFLCCCKNKAKSCFGRNKG